MLTHIEAILLGALQGVSELFPISSLGHSVILPGLVGWSIDTHEPYFLVFLVATHFATATVLFFFYFGDWMRILRGFLNSVRKMKIESGDVDARLAWLLIVSTIPAGLLGLLFESQIREYFISPLSAAFFLILNGALLFGAERLRRRAPESGAASDSRIAKLSFKQGLLVGTMQILALIPGFSRTGASLAGGLWVGLSHEDALRFSFLLATPIIGAAALLKLPELFHAHQSDIAAAAIGAVFSGFCAYLAVRFLTRYFHAERHTLTPFAIYCTLAGLVSLSLILF